MAKPKDKLTRKQKAFADHLLANPKESPTQAALKTYNTESYGTAAVIAHELMHKPHVQAYLDIHSDKASDTILEVMEYSKQYGKSGGKDGAAYAGVALTAAKDVLDRIHGKATQKTETVSTTVELKLDLTNITSSEKVPVDAIDTGDAS